MSTSTASENKAADTTQQQPELPVLFLSHAAPVLFMGTEQVMGVSNDSGVGSPAYKWYEQLAKQLHLDSGARRPKAIVVVSAHWEENQKTYVTAQDKHKTLYYDYYGFAKHLYDIKYPSPGSVKLANRIVELLEKGPHALPAAVNTERNIDHAAFIPLKLIYPEADIPVLEVSLMRHLDPSYHVKLGESLAPLRKEGVLIIGSGQLSHNAFHLFGDPSARKKTQVFVDALTANLKGVNAVKAAKEEANSSGKAVDADALAAAIQAERVAAVVNWKKYPNAQFAHPREEHLAPLFAAVGAARGSDEAHVVGDHWMMNLHSLRTIAFGDISAPSAASAAANDGDAK